MSLTKNATYLINQNISITPFGNSFRGHPVVFYEDEINIYFLMMSSEKETKIYYYSDSSLSDFIKLHKKSKGTILVNDSYLDMRKIYSIKKNLFEKNLITKKYDLLSDDEIKEIWNNLHHRIYSNPPNIMVVNLAESYNPKIRHFRPKIVYTYNEILTESAKSEVKQFSKEKQITRTNKIVESITSLLKNNFYILDKYTDLNQIEEIKSLKAIFKEEM